jgi:hypothetical protein
MEGSQRHLLDLKIPLGGLLCFYGLVLLTYGLVSDASLYQKSFGININIGWGIFVLIVGGIFVMAHFLKRKK